MWLKTKIVTFTNKENKREIEMRTLLLLKRARVRLLLLLKRARKRLLLCITKERERKGKVWEAGVTAV